MAIGLLCIAAAVGNLYLLALLFLLWWPLGALLGLLELSWFIGSLLE